MLYFFSNGCMLVRSVAPTGARLARKASSANDRLGSFIVSDSASDSGASDSGSDSTSEGKQAAGAPGGFDWASGNVQELIRALVQQKGVQPAHEFTGTMMFGLVTRTVVLHQYTAGKC